MFMSSSRFQSSRSRSVHHNLTTTNLKTIMQTNNRTQLVAPCGIDCGICELYLCRENEQLKTYLLGRGIPADRLPCPGCRAIKGNCPVIPDTCATYSCIQQKGKDYCFECEGFPCRMLQPSADRADVLPHNLKVFNLCTIQRSGVEGFIGESATIKRTYYKGKMSVGKGPQLSE